MGYIKEFETRIGVRDFSRFLNLWEEYLTCDIVDPKELIEVLLIIKQSDFCQSFGEHVETALELVEKIEDEEKKYRVLSLIFDLQTTDTSRLRDVAWETLENRYKSNPNFRDWQRLAGIRGNGTYQAILHKFDLLSHLKKGAFVFHTGGWGTGEVMDISLVREQIQLEFENVGGVKEFSFNNAFKVLEPLPNDHFFALRFFDPDLLEEKAKKDPVGIIKKYLIDVGPSTAQEIKDAFNEVIIPEKEWPKWWQGVRNRLKKDPMMDIPKDSHGHFFIRDEAKSVKEHLQEVLKHQENLEQFIPILYAFIRDVPHALKEEEISNEIRDGLIKMLEQGQNEEISLQLALFLEQYFDKKIPDHDVQSYINKIEHPEELLSAISVTALKKRILEAIYRERSDWVELFFKTLESSEPVLIRDYLFKELLLEAPDRLDEWLHKLVQRPQSQPDTFVWFFQKALSGKSIPYATKKGRCELLDALLILLSFIEHDEKYKELSRKIYHLLSGKRFLIVRQIIEGTDRSFLKEFLLLASKCHSILPNDQKILQSLVAVVDPTLSSKEVEIEDRFNPNIIWATQSAFEQSQERIKKIGTVEMIENAKEIEEARAHGDLRENSEYKFAQEKRRRLQGEMKHLSDQLQAVRVILKEDVMLDAVGVGNVVTLVDSKEEKVMFSILGQWDADPDKHILSAQSQLAQAMLGKKKGESFNFKDESFRVEEIGSFFGE
ncbi:GreA/GreB family elongation factor [Chlamydiales bacterium]|nr:GreA/GreB family elongation factor [Chlamydiales bacterium]